MFNAAAQRFFPLRTWAGDLRRPRLAGLLSVPLVWGLPLLSAAFGIDPGRSVERTFGIGWIEAWIVGIGGQMLLGSMVCLMIAWSLPPRPAKSRKLPVVMKKARP
jgi:hypothetical protein